MVLMAPFPNTWSVTSAPRAFPEVASTTTRQPTMANHVPRAFLSPSIAHLLSAPGGFTLQCRRPSRRATTLLEAAPVSIQVGGGCWRWRSLRPWAVSIQVGGVCSTWWRDRRSCQTQLARRPLGKALRQSDTHRGLLPTAREPSRIASTVTSTPSVELGYERVLSPSGVRGLLVRCTVLRPREQARGEVPMCNPVPTALHARLRAPRYMHAGGCVWGLRPVA